MKSAEEILRFRLSLIGAWRLGADFEKRRGVHKNLLEVFDAASEPVYIGALEYFENHKLLSTSQDLCRRGFLNLLVEWSPGG